MREFFHARPGWVLVDADYSQIELRVLAAIANDSKMLEAFAAGQDIHTMTAATVFGVEPHAVMCDDAVNTDVTKGSSMLSMLSA